MHFPLSWASRAQYFLRRRTQYLLPSAENSIVPTVQKLFSRRASSRWLSSLTEQLKIDTRSFQEAGAPMVEATADIVTHLSPPQVWKHFWELTQIPRPSGHEAQVSNYVKDIAERKGLDWAEDSTGNLVVKLKGAGDFAEAAPVLIQGHLDMVCEKEPDVQHDFFKDPLKLEMDGEWLKAAGTTLGADNGIGVATALALMECQPTNCPPLELLFTVDEERGLIGAKSLDPKSLGLSCSRMLNLDSEKWGEVCIGCAGGGDVTLELKAEEQEIPPGFGLFDLRVSGLLGGHSGLEIDQYRGNAIKWLAILIASILKRAPTVKIVELKGGDKRNALPRDAAAVLAIPEHHVEDAKNALVISLEGLLQQYSEKERSASAVLEVHQGLHTSCVLDDVQFRLVGLLTALPHGPHKFSHSMPGLVETSSNLASIKHNRENGTYTVVMSVRSSISLALEQLRSEIAIIAGLAGAVCSKDKAYPGWKPEPKSPICSIVQNCFKEMTGSSPLLVALHAGLECGILMDHVPGIDAVSYGPTITGAHSPDERVHVPSVELFWQLTLNVLKKAGEQLA